MNTTFHNVLLRLGDPATSIHEDPAGLEPPFTFETTAVPPEIWLKVFAYLAPAELRASSTTCSSFRWLAQPLLFTIINVSPFFLAYNVDHRILRPPQYLDRTVERLKFYRSSHIAPAVKHAWISPYSRHGFPPRNPNDYLEPELIINQVLATLPYFPNLCKLSWHCINISTEWWDVLRKLPITTLWLNSCTIDGVDIPQLPIRHLDLDQWAWEGEITNFVSVHEEDLAGVSSTALNVVLHPEQIEYISVPRLDTCSRLLPILANMDTRTSLRVLHVPFLAMSSPHFIGTLIQCPNLEELRIFSPTDNEHSEVTMDYLPPTALHHLSIYEGPYTYLQTFGMGRPLRKALVWGPAAESPAHCDPHGLVQTLHQVSHSNPTLESLYISVAYIINELFTVISSFNQLKYLEISSVDSPAAEGTRAELHYRSSSVPITLLFATLRDVHFPMTLETLRVLTKLNHGSSDRPTQQQEASRAVEYVAEKHPLLRSIVIGYGTYWTGTCTIHWLRRDSPLDSRAETLGKFNFSERRRTIVFPDPHESISHARRTVDKAGQRGLSLVAWLRYIYSKYF